MMFGPDGKPIQSNILAGGQLIGLPKTFEELTPEPFSDVELEAIVADFERKMVEVVATMMTQTGLPQAEIYKAPAAVPMGPLTLVRLAKTLKVLQQATKAQDHSKE